jgi:transcription-repair coupling factor (superfamily II helicase)
MVRELKGEEIQDEIRAAVNLRVDLRISEQYIPDMNQRLAVYRRVAATRTESEIDRLLEEMSDRYGPVPPSLLNLAEYCRIRLMADRLGVEALDRDGQILVLRFRSTAAVDPGRLIRFVQDRPDVTLTPPAVLRVNLRQPAPSRAGRSWWTARATAGEVKPGFTRAEILKPGKVDPRGAEGIFGRVVGLLVELSGDA